MRLPEWMMCERLFAGLVALLLVGCEGPDVPSAPPLQSGPASNTLFSPEQGADATMVAEAVCTKLIECMGGQGLAENCVKEMVRYTSFVIDAASFATCFNSISCEDLDRYSQIDDQLERCLDLDRASLYCEGDAVHYCNRQGACKEIQCAAFCELVTETPGGSCVTRDGTPTCRCNGELDRLPDG
jgi:hypothetical protein